MTKNNKNTPTDKDYQFWKNVKIIINNITKEYDKSWIKRNRGINSKFLIDFIFTIITGGDKGYAITLGGMWNNYLLKNIILPQQSKVDPICWTTSF